jgi:DNA-binding Xre family transcriptional regulator
MNNSTIGSSFETFLEEEDIKDEVETNAVKRIIALQMQENLRQKNLTKTELAAQLETSRAAIDRLLDPYNEAVTLVTLKKAASIMGKKIKLELV